MSRSNPRGERFVSRPGDSVFVNPGERPSEKGESCACERCPDSAPVTSPDEQEAARALLTVPVEIARTHRFHTEFLKAVEEVTGYGRAELASMVGTIGDVLEAIRSHRPDETKSAVELAREIIAAGRWRFVAELEARRRAFEEAREDLADWDRLVGGSVSR